MNEQEADKLEQRRAEKQRAAEALAAEQDAQREAEDRAFNATHPPQVTGGIPWAEQRFTTHDLEREREGVIRPRDLEPEPKVSWRTRLSARVRGALFAD